MLWYILRQFEMRCRESWGGWGIDERWFGNVD